MVRVAMAIRRATATRPKTSFYLLCTFLFTTTATMNVPAVAKSSSPPSTLVIYAHQNTVPPDNTIVDVATPSGNFSALEFGTTFVVADILRETAAADSTVVGAIAGLVVVEKDFSLYASNTYVLNTTSFAGSVSIQGSTDLQGAGEIAITGGTYDFRFARGYVDSTVVSQGDPRDTVLKLVLNIKYDY